MLVTLICHHCAKEFQLEAWAAKRGRGKYCSHECYSQGNKGSTRPTLLRRVQKQCVTCGKDFEVGGRAGPIEQPTCSRECGYKIMYRHGRVCMPLAPLDAAYLAGFWDGEGSFMLHGRSGTGSIAFRAAVVGTKVEVINWVKEITGIGVIIHHKDPNPNWAEKHLWWVNGDGAWSFTKQLLPYLKLKRLQAELAIAFQERLREPSLKADRSWQEEWRQKMRDMNRRGPVKQEEAT